MPDVGEGLTEAEVLTWHVAVGDTLTVNQVMVEIETAKAAVELPSPFAGRVHALLVEPGVTVEVGTPIITVDTDPGAGPIEDLGQPDRPVTDRPNVGERANGNGAKIGEVAADGRIATLVGYTSAAAATSRGAATAGPRPRRRGHLPHSATRRCRPQRTRRCDRRASSPAPARQSPGAAGHPAGAQAGQGPRHRSRLGARQSRRTA